MRVVRGLCGSSPAMRENTGFRCNKNKRWSEGRIPRETARTHGPDRRRQTESGPRRRRYSPAAQSRGCDEKGRRFSFANVAADAFDRAAEAAGFEVVSGLAEVSVFRVIDGRQFFKPLAGLSGVAQPRISFGKPEQQFASRVSRQFIKPGGLDLVDVLVIGESHAEQFFSIVARDGVAGGQQGGAARYHHSNIIGGEGHGRGHLVKPLFIKLGGFGEITAFRGDAAEEESAGAMPDHGLWVLGIGGQSLLAFLHRPVEGGAISGQPSEEIVAHHVVEAFLGAEDSRGQEQREPKPCKHQNLLIVFEPGLRRGSPGFRRGVGMADKGSVWEEEWDFPRWSKSTWMRSSRTNGPLTSGLAPGHSATTDAWSENSGLEPSPRAREPIFHA